LLIKDLEKKIEEVQTNEENALKNYENVTTAALSKRNTDVKSLASKRSAKAGLENDLAEQNELKVSASKELWRLQNIHPIAPYRM